MATSGSKNFSISRGDVIGGALRRIGAYDQNESVPGEEDEDAAFALNVLVKEWSAFGLDIWLRKEITVFLQKNQQSYQIGLTSTDHATTDTIAESTLSAAAISGATTLAITSTTGMADADQVGIKLDNNTIHWTTFVSVALGTITTGLTSAASAGNRVYAYTNEAERPQKLLYINRRDTNAIDTEMDLIGENEYRLLSTKGSAGPPNQAWYKPTLDTGTLFMWPVDGGKTWDKVITQAQFLVDDFDTTADEPEFPIEWGNALIFQLAHDISGEYGVTEQRQARLYAIAKQKLNDLLDYDEENASVVFALDGRAGRR